MSQRNGVTLTPFVIICPCLGRSVCLGRSIRLSKSTKSTEYSVEAFRTHNYMLIAPVERYPPLICNSSLPLILEGSTHASTQLPWHLPKLVVLYVEHILIPTATVFELLSSQSQDEGESHGSLRDYSAPCRECRSAAISIPPSCLATGMQFLLDPDSFHRFDSVLNSVSYPAPRARLSLVVSPWCQPVPIPVMAQQPRPHV